MNAYNYHWRRALSDRRAHLSERARAADSHAGQGGGTTQKRVNLGREREREGGKRARYRRRLSSPFEVSRARFGRARGKEQQIQWVYRAARVAPDRYACIGGPARAPRVIL